MEGRDYLKDVGVDGRVILNCCLVNKQYAPACTGDFIRTRC